MCGIFGIASQFPTSNRQWLSLGRDYMQHRGPDSAGEWWSPDGRVGLAHRRLSIINLDTNANQPMSYKSLGLEIVFNGEIYNYQELREILSVDFKFVTQSDTEVLLAAYYKWGENCLRYLNGMFAFAIYDSTKRKLFLARDRAGEKPLYYRHTGKELRFASELKALLADNSVARSLDKVALEFYLAYGYVPGADCILQGFQKLPPGYALFYELDSDSLNTWQYWDLPEFAGGIVDDAALLDELEFLLEDSVRKQLTADRSVGILLSGGLDSSLITAMAVRTTPKVKTFTASFPGYGSLDEAKHARLIANYFATEHVELEVSQQEASAMLPILARQFDEPMADSSMFPTFMISQLIKNYCAVALGGDGGDELFGGYRQYSRLLLLTRYLQIMPKFIFILLDLFAERVLPVGMKGRNWLRYIAGISKHGLPVGAPFFDPRIRNVLLPDYFASRHRVESIMTSRLQEDKDIVQLATRRDFKNYLAEDILVKVDRASMLNSLEVRAPFLDHRIIEFAFSKVPSRLKATRNSKKILLKSLAEKLLPAEFDKHRKQGFSIPLAAWLQKGSLRKLFHEVLLDNSSIFNRKVVVKLLKGQDQGQANSERLFALVLFELWRREYNVQV